MGHLAAVDEGLTRAAIDHVERARTQALEIARWAGLGPARLAEFQTALPDSAAAVREDRLGEALGGLRSLLVDRFPEIGQHHGLARTSAEKLRASALELGLPTPALDVALTADASASVEAWPASVKRLEEAAAELGEAMRRSTLEALEALRRALGGLGSFGVDAAAARAKVELALARLPAAPPEEIAGLLGEVRAAAEEPIVTVVAGLLDEVRPRIASARKLGRDPSDVFAAMYRAREALRLKIYSEAIAAGQEALDKVRALTEDLDAAREELATLQEMVERFRSVGFTSATVVAQLERIRLHLDRSEVPPARELLAEAVRDLGNGAVGFFLERWKALDGERAFAEARGFLPAEATTELHEARSILDRGDLGGAADALARGEVALRTAAAPFVARRVEEMEIALRELPDERLTTPVRRMLADADVMLRVKEDLLGSLENLRGAEKALASAFASHAAALIAALEEQAQVLAAIGGAGDEIRHQIAEVEQLFRAGDFVRASQACKEIRARAVEQQKLRAEEAVAHAKLALAELEALDLDLAPMRKALEEAQGFTEDHRYADAYRAARVLEEDAGRRRGVARELHARFERAEATLGRVRDLAPEAAPALEKTLTEARAALRELEFDRAGTLAADLESRLEEAEARAETERRLGEIALLIEDGRQLGVPMEPFVARLDRLRTEATTAAAEATREGTRLLHEELVATVRPILEEHLQALERDLDVARSAGVALEAIVTKVAEARRRLANPVPTGSAKVLDELRRELFSVRGFVDQAERVARRVREALAQADLLHVDVAALRGKVDEIERALDAREYARVIKRGGSTERELIQATYEHVSKTLASFQAGVTQLRRAGGNAAVAENLLHQARMALDEGRPVEALQFAARSESELETATLQHRLAEGSLSAAEQSLVRATDEGIVATEATDGLKAAKEAFARNDFPEVLEQSMAVAETLAAARDGHRQARDALAAADRQLAEAVELGADVREATGRISEARAESLAGHYLAAVRLGREAIERARWSIERMFSAPLGELRHEIDVARTAGAGPEVDALDVVVTEAEASLRAGSWARVSSALSRAEEAGGRLFAALVDARRREIEAEAGPGGGGSDEEAARAAEIASRLEKSAAARDLEGALKLLQEELERVRESRREELGRALASFRDRLWIGERLGVDTTPVMQTFGEARIALDQGRFQVADRLLREASEALVGTLKAPFGKRRDTVANEVAFADGGLHVEVEPLRTQLKEVDELATAGKLLDAAAQLARTEQELNLRKSLHRELTNLHYLVDAALARADEKNVPADDARALLTESLRLRSTDYPAALEKAREALKVLQEKGISVGEAAPSAPGKVWPFQKMPDGRVP